jgi:hypothetical protein
MMRWLLTLALCLVVADAFGAVAFVQSKPGVAFTASSVGITYDSNPTNANALACYAFWDTNTVTLDSVTDGTNTYTLYDNPTTSGNIRAGLAVAKNITGGALTTTFNFSGSAGTINAVCHEVSGADTTDPVDKHAINAQSFAGTGADFITSGSVTTTTNGQYIFGATRSEFGSGQTPGTGYTQRNDAFLESEDQVQGSGGPIAATFTPGGNDNYLTGILTLKAAGAGGGAPNLFPRRLQAQ